MINIEIEPIIVKTNTGISRSKNLSFFVIYNPKSFAYKKLKKRIDIILRVEIISFFKPLKKPNIIKINNTISIKISNKIIPKSVS